MLGHEIIKGCRCFFFLLYDISHVIPAPHVFCVLGRLDSPFYLQSAPHFPSHGFTLRLLGGRNTSPQGLFAFSGNQTSLGREGGWKEKHKKGT